MHDLKFNFFFYLKFAKLEFHSDVTCISLREFFSKYETCLRFCYFSLHFLNLRPNLGNRNPYHYSSSNGPVCTLKLDRPYSIAYN